MDTKALGNYIKTCRINAGLTQEQLGEKCGLSGSVVSRWEKGKNLPGKDLFPILAKEIGLDFGPWMLSGTYDSLEKTQEELLLVQYRQLDKNAKNLVSEFMDILINYQLESRNDETIEDILKDGYN